MSDKFLTISAPASARLNEKMSRFLGFIHPVGDAEQAKQLVKEYRAKYRDARHVCWAYMLGPERKEWQNTDDGEPSGTAGRPILGQINSAGLTDVIIIIVRYFGGIKLGTPGLIQAYKEAARLSIEAAETVEKTDMAQIRVEFPYDAMNSVMKIAKEPGVESNSQTFDLQCSIILSVSRSQAPFLRERLEKIEGVKCS